MAAVVAIALVAGVFALVDRSGGDSPVQRIALTEIDSSGVSDNGDRA
ncbi:MAG: hypothetical protein U0W40_11525 [Acidimicrobiia bacterium]